MNGISKVIRGRPPWLDRERCFYFWMELGNIPKACKRLFREGYHNPTTKEMPSVVGVRIAAWKHVLYNPEETRKTFIERFGVFGENQTELWINKLDRLAIAFLTTRADRYRDWKREIYDPYVEKLK